MPSEQDPRQHPSPEGNDDWKARIPHESFEGTAIHLGIPKENWQDPEVQRLINLINRVSALQRDLTIADARNLPFKLAAERYVELNNGLEQSLSDRYSSAELLMRVALQILEQGFQGNVAHPDYLKSKLNSAVNGYDLKVERFDSGL